MYIKSLAIIAFIAFASTVVLADADESLKCVKDVELVAPVAPLFTKEVVDEFIALAKSEEEAAKKNHAAAIKVITELFVENKILVKVTADAKIDENAHKTIKTAAEAVVTACADVKTDEKVRALISAIAGFFKAAAAANLDKALYKDGKLPTDIVYAELKKLFDATKALDKGNAKIKAVNLPETLGGSSILFWVLVGIVAIVVVAIIGVAIFFLTRK